MSRPPHPHPPKSAGREQAGDLQRLEYLPLEFANLLALQDDLAIGRLGRPLPERVQEADVARTFMELSALLAHVLAVYQRHYAGEAFISTARAPSSLVRHARRLAYDPDPGLAAAGYVVLVAKDDVSGTVPAGLPLASVPLGEIKAQDYETEHELAVDAALNELLPVAGRQPVVVPAHATEIRLSGTGHGLRPGDAVALVGARWKGLVVDAVSEDPADDSTTVAFDRQLGHAVNVAAEAPVLLAGQRLLLRPFGADADPVLFPPASVHAATATEQSESPRYQYEVARAGGGGYDDADIYLGDEVTEPLVGGHVLRRAGTALAVFRVTTQVAAAITLRRAADETFTVHAVTLTPTTSGGFTSALTPHHETLTVSSSIGASGTAIRVEDDTGATVARATHAFPADWLAGWGTEIPLAGTEPNAAPLVAPLDLPGLHAALIPGRAVIFADHEEKTAQVVTIRRAELRPDDEVTRIWWDPAGPAPIGGWQLGGLKVLGNVARVSHGRTVDETLGGSDGVTAFQRFALAESRVTVLPGVAGGEPELRVLVDDVLWQRVEEFAASGPDDRHYRTETDEEGVTTVVFGDGRNGAVPPSGTKNVRAEYRVGLGEEGDVEPLRLSRIKRAHPLLDRVVNLTPVSGGAAPAGSDAIRTQSTRWIRTFNRAVSVPDLADLALLMPGIARSAARWDQSLGVLLVVATAAGEGPESIDDVRRFLDVRRDVGVPLTVRGPRLREVRLTIDVEPDPAFLAELVRDAVRAALHGDRPEAPGLFTFAARDLGQPAYLSEVYERLEAVPGVIGVRVEQFESRTADGVADVIVADVDEWLKLAPNDLTVTLAARGA